MQTDDEIGSTSESDSIMKLSLQTLANALDLPLSTIERWIRQGRIPIQRIGKDAVFSLSTLERWATSLQLSLVLEKDPIADPTDKTFDSLVSVMMRGSVYHDIDGTDGTEALQSVVNCIDFLSDDVQNELFEKLVAREQLASTGIGNGIAIPHPRDPISQAPKSAIITTCFLKQPINFNAIDDQPVFVFFLLISPTVKHHLHLLSRLSYCIRDKAFVNLLRKHPDANELFSHVAAFEKQLDEP